MKYKALMPQGAKHKKNIFIWNYGREKFKLFLAYPQFCFLISHSLL